MHRFAIAVAATVVLGAMSIPADARHHRLDRHQGDVGVVDNSGGNDVGNHRFEANGSFDWRRRRPASEIPWYARGYSGDCLAWTPNAYHYACDVNSRY